MRADDVADLSRSEWTRVIDEHIHDELWRRIFKRRWLDGVKLEPLAEEFDLSPRGMIAKLDLRRPIYRKTAAYGHFGRPEPEFTWEKLDMVDRLREAAGL